MKTLQPSAFSRGFLLTPPPSAIMNDGAVGSLGSFGPYPAGYWRGTSCRRSLAFSSNTRSE